MILAISIREGQAPQTSHDNTVYTVAARGSPRKLTFGNLKMLWETGPACLWQVHGVLQERLGVAITTVATMLKMILTSELVQRDDGPRGYLWSARVSRKAAVSGLLGKLLQHVFDGSARRLVAHLIEEGELDEKERDEILEILQTWKDKDQRRSPKKKRANP